MSKLVLSSVLALFAATATFADPQSVALKSPDSQLSITFNVAGKDAASSAPGQLVYSVAFHNKPLIEASKLNLTLQGQRPLGANVRISATTPSSADQTYRLITGKASTVRDHYNALRIDLDEEGGLQRKLAIEARAYDDAIAFRYVVPEQRPLRDFRLAKESTEFRISTDATSYALELPNFHSMYESEYIKLPISAFSNQGGVASKFLIGLPLLMEVPGVAWMAITEANLRDYSSMYLVNEAGGWSSHGFTSELAPSGENPELAVEGSLPHHSAWRVLLIGDKPGALLESNVITSLNPESEIKDTGWIHGGRASWDWWNGSIDQDGKSAYTTDTMKYYVDFAAKQGLEYMLVDAGWYAKNDITKMNGKVDVPALVQYAKAKGVKIWIWIPYTLADAQMGEAFPLYAQWGVAGLKIDFIERDDQQGINFYYRAAKLAADNHLLLDFHGATKPTGLERTYPNVFGYEAVLGMEQSKGGRRDNPDNHVMLPFTRMLAGRMDYTPGGFDNVTKDAFVPRNLHPMVMGTRCHQLAMYAIYESPFQMVSDTPKAYEDQPSFQFIKDLPGTWDETKILNGEPGEFVTLVRRNGKQWFLGSMTNWNPREFDVPLTFLGEGAYTAEIYEDADDADQNPKNARILKKSVTAKTVLHVKLSSGGGYAVRFVPAGT
ncbi:MAG TPA: glycoside hydrolase family 97 protein [Bryobacteraceae bacterium]